MSTRPWLHDPEILPVPYRSYLEINRQEVPRLAFGILSTDGIVTPHPPILRAIREVGEALVAAGHKVELLGTCFHADCH